MRDIILVQVCIPFAPQPPTHPVAECRWGLELDEYARRLGDHPQRLQNLHFTYLTVLRAVELASSGRPLQPTTE